MLSGVKFRGAFTGVSQYDVILDSFVDSMHLIYNLFGHLIKLTTSVDIQPLPPFVARARAPSESQGQYNVAIRSEREAYESRAAEVKKCIDTYALFALDNKQRYEVCRRFRSILAFPRQVGTGSPYKNFGTLNTASVHFFMKYCSWIYTDLPGLAQPQVKIIKKMFALAKICLQRRLPCKVERGLGDYIIRLVYKIHT